MDVAVVDDLHEVAPGIAEVEETPGDDLDAGFLERRPDGVLVACARPSARAMNWSPIEMNAILGSRPRSSRSKMRP